MRLGAAAVTGGATGCNKPVVYLLYRIAYMNYLHQVGNIFLCVHSTCQFLT